MIKNMANLYKSILNGDLIEADKFTIPANDIGFLRGYGVFDLLRTYQGNPFHLMDHINRLFESANRISLKIPYSPQLIKKWTLQGLEANNDGIEKTVRFIATGGALQGALSPSLENPLIAITFSGFSKPNQDLYKAGASAFTAKYIRSYPEAKTLNYLDAVVRLQDPKHKNAVEFIYYDDSQVYEGASSNIFAVIDGKLMTTKTNILSGITRKVIIKELKNKPEISVENFNIDQLKRAAEIFITSSVREVLPITTLDNAKVGDGKVGTITRSIMDNFNTYVEDKDWCSGL